MLQILGGDIQDLSIGETKQALFVFENLGQLPDSEALLSVLKNHYVHIIVLNESYVLTEKLVKEVDRKLIRGCKFLDTKPLTMIHSTQRIVHSFMKEHEFTPANDDQLVFEKLAEFTSGSPALVEIASMIACSCFEQSEDPVLHLADLLSLKSKYQTKESYSIEEPSSWAVTRAVTRTVSSNMREFINSVTKLQVDDSQGRDVWTTNADYDSWDSTVILVDSCNLSVEERLLLNSLSVFNCSPIPYSVVAELAVIIANSSQKPHIAGTLDHKLFKFKLLCNYPHPVVFHDSCLCDSTQNKQNDFKLVYVPHHVSQCLWKNSEKVDQIAVLNLVYHALSHLYQTLPTQSRSDLHWLNTLCSLLLETCDSNFALLGKECYQEIYGFFLTCASHFLTL